MPEPKSLPMDRLWTVKDVAYYLSKSEDAIYKMKDRGQIPYKRIHGRIYFDPVEITEWAKAEGRVFEAVK